MGYGQYLRARSGIRDGAGQLIVIWVDQVMGGARGMMEEQSVAAGVCLAAVPVIWRLTSPAGTT